MLNTNIYNLILFFIFLPFINSFAQFSIQNQLEIANSDSRIELSETNKGKLLGTSIRIMYPVKSFRSSKLDLGIGYKFLFSNSEFAQRYNSTLFGTVTNIIVYNTFTHELALPISYKKHIIRNCSWLVLIDNNFLIKKNFSSGLENRFDSNFRFLGSEIILGSNFQGSHWGITPFIRVFSIYKTDKNIFTQSIGNPSKKYNEQINKPFNLNNPLNLGFQISYDF